VTPNAQSQRTVSDISDFTPLGHAHSSRNPVNGGRAPRFLLSGAVDRDSMWDLRP
jgi:hypothetical protein